MRDDKLTRQGVRNLDLIGPRPPKRTSGEHVHEWTDWRDTSTESDDVRGVVHEVRECMTCAEVDARTTSIYGGSRE